MQERDEISVSTLTWSLIDQLNSSFAQTRQLGGQVWYAISSVVQFCLCVSSIACDRGARVQRTKQFDDCVPGAQPNRLDALVIDYFPVNLFESQNIDVKL